MTETTGISERDVVRYQAVFESVCDAVGRRMAALAAADRDAPGTIPGQYAFDLDADDEVASRLKAIGCNVLSEESGWTDRGSTDTVVVDPVDGSTNASRGLGWWATSLCLIRDGEPVLALVRQQAAGVSILAIEGGGVHCNAPWFGRSRVAIAHPDAAIMAVNGMAPSHLGWAQSRTFGAISLDLCAVAGGALDGYLDAEVANHGVWDYAAGVVAVREAGGAVLDAFGRELFTLDHAERRTPVAGRSLDAAEEWVARGHAGGWWQPN